MALNITADRLRAAGLSTELAAIVIELARLAHKEPRSGKDGRGIADSAFDLATGQLTLTLTDGSTIVTSDLRGRDLSVEVAALLAEIVAARGNNRVEMAPFLTARRLLVDRIGVSVVTGVADAVGRCFIYGTGADGWPDPLLWEASGNLDQSTAGFTEHLLSEPFEFLPGVLYWLGHRHSINTATLRGVALGSAMSLGPVSAVSNQYAVQLRRTVTFATPLPENWGFAEGDLTGNAPPPAIRMRAI